MADLLTVLHDIDRMRGRICGKCRFWIDQRYNDAGRCRKSHAPYGSDDGCEDWQPRTNKQVAA